MGVEGRKEEWGHLLIIGFFKIHLDDSDVDAGLRMFRLNVSKFLCNCVLEYTHCGVLVLLCPEMTITSYENK